MTNLKFDNYYMCQDRTSRGHKITKFLRVVVIIIIITLLQSTTFGLANTAGDEDYVKDLYDSTYLQLDDIDFSQLDNILSDIEDPILSSNFYDLARSILEGNADIDAGNILQYALRASLSNFKSLLPFIFAVIVIAVVVRILNIFSPNMFKNGVAEIINLVSVGVVIILLSSIVVKVSASVFATIHQMQNITNILFPILLGLMATTGAVSSVSIYTPITTILNVGVTNILSNFLYPIFVISFALICVGAVSHRLKLDKFVSFLASLFKSVVSFVFVIFSGVFVIKGISAGKYDSIGVYTTKFAVKNYVPIIGSYISEGFNYIMLSSVIVKNAVGLAGIIIILVIVMSPAMYLLISKLVIQLTASVVDIVGGKDISNLLDKVAKIFAFPVAILLGVAFMFVMSISLVICTANLL